METDYKFLPELFLRAPYYSFTGYDLERLPEVLATTIFRNAIWLASPDFYKVLERMDFDFEKLSAKEKHTLSKYYNRMCFRPTPFGSFASFTNLKWGDGGPVKLAGDDYASLHLLPAETGLQCLRSQQPANGSRVMINPTLYPFDKEYRFVKSAKDDQGRYQFSLEALSMDKFYNVLFGWLKKKALTTEELVLKICKWSGCTADDAAAQLKYLTDEQVLFDERTGHIIGNAGGSAGERPQTFSLKTPRVPDYIIENQMFLNNDSKTCCYAALERKCESGNLSIDEQQELLAAMAVLRRLCQPVLPVDLKKFIADFKERFDLEKVPLLLALDPDAGIAYGNNSVSGIVMDFGAIRFPPQPAPAPSLEWQALHRLLLQLWGRAQQNHRFAPVIITNEDLDNLSGHVTGMPPPTLAVMFRTTEEHLVVDYTSGASATSLPGRFSVFSQETARLCKKLADRESEANPDVLFADIGQLSHLHADNVNRREILYPFEIPVNVFPVQPASRLIQPADLLVFVRNGELILESVKLKKRVIPRLASAYNYQHNGLGLFRLLCDLQYQGLHATHGFSLESIFPGLNFYPRVMYGQTIFSLATWHFREAELGLILNPASGELLKAARRFRNQFGLPQHVSIGDSDQQLVFNLAVEQEVLFFIDCIKSLKKLTVTEYLLPGRIIKMGNKPLAGQFIAFLAHNHPVYRAIPPEHEQTQARRPRNFLLGDEWLYLKIYCTPESAGQLLAEVIAPLTRMHRKLIGRWFFIRYFENGHHLRLRINTKEEHIGSILTALKRSLEKPRNNKLVRNYQGDVYKREIERYGAAIIEEVETVFCSGSDLLAAYTVLRTTGKLAMTEFLFGMLTAHRMAGVFITDPHLLADFYRLTAKRFITGFAGDKSLTIQLDSKYRKMRREIETLLDSKESNKPHRKFVDFLNDTESLRRKVKHYHMERQHKLLTDLIHMQLNRTFKGKHQVQEMLVYYFLSKYMGTRIARNGVTVAN